MPKEYILFYAKEKPQPMKEFIVGERTRSSGDVMAQDPEAYYKTYILQDKETGEKIEGRVIVSPNKEDIPDGDIVWLHDKVAYGGKGEEKPWYIKILEVFEEEEEVVVRKPTKIALGKMRGSMIAYMLKQREEKEKQEQQKE